MSLPTYLQRIQQVFSDLTKAHTLAIEYQRFLDRVRPRMLRSSMSVISTFRAGVREAVVYEISRGHIAIDTAEFPTTVRFTEVGNAFFTNLILPLPSKRRASHPPPPRPSRKVEASKEYQDLATTLRSIQTLFAEKTFVEPACYTVPKLPKMVGCYLELEQDLREENFTLGFRVNDLEWELEQMQHALQAQEGVGTVGI